jgi:hypothetical protein
MNEDNIEFDGMPEDLWADFPIPIDALPPDPPS